MDARRGEFGHRRFIEVAEAHEPAEEDAQRPVVGGSRGIRQRAGALPTGIPTFRFLKIEPPGEDVLGLDGVEIGRVVACFEEADEEQDGRAIPGNGARAAFAVGVPFDE